MMLLVAKSIRPEGPGGLAVKLDLHLVNVGSIPSGPMQGEVRLQSLPGDVLKSTLNVRKSARSGLNLEGRLSDPQVFCFEVRLQPHPGNVLKPTPNVRKSRRSGLNLEGRLSDPQLRPEKDWEGMGFSLYQASNEHNFFLDGNHLF